jgi:hypothetical protein
MKRNQHRIRYGNSIHRPASAPEKSAPDKIWHNLLTWSTRLDEDTLEALTEALRPRRLRAG